jgi:membrane protease YdiL (CAAX protease family)
MRDVLGQGPPPPGILLATGLGAAVAEEVLFRVFLLGALLDAGVRRLPAVALTAILWSLLHAGTMDPFVIKVIQLLPAGLLLGWLRLRHGVWAAVLAHAAGNAAALAAELWL